MKKVTLYAGQPFPSKKEIDIEIHFKESFPTLGGPHWLEEGEALFEKQAKELEETLIAALPGGTYDRLLGLMLERKASHFVISHKEKAKPVPVRNCANCGIMAKSSCDSCDKVTFSKWIPRNWEA